MTPGVQGQVRSVRGPEVLLSRPLSSLTLPHIARLYSPSTHRLQGHLSGQVRTCLGCNMEVQRETKLGRGG